MAYEVIDGVKYDTVWEDPGSKNQPGALKIRRNMHVQRGGYRLWCGLYLLMSLLVIGSSLATLFFLVLLGLVLVGHASMDAIGDGYILVLLAAFANVASILLYAVYRPNEEFRRYMRAVQKNQMARSHYQDGDKEGASRILEEAIALTE